MFLLYRGHLSQNQSVFEKLISNAQLQGIQLARTTIEKTVIEPLKDKNEIEKIMEQIKQNNKRIPDARDIIYTKSDVI